MQTLIMLGGLVITLLLVAQAERVRIMPVPTRPAVRRAALALMQAHAPHARRIIDLGSGWGGMTRLLAKAYPEAEVQGCERSLIPFAVSRLLVRRARITRDDIFALDLADTDLIFCYLSPWHMQRCATLFDTRLKPGAILVSAAFPLPGRAPLAQAQSGPTTLYLYRFGE